MNAVPVVLFAFNRPEKLQSVLDALKPQGIQKLIVFVDAARHTADEPMVERCKQMAKAIDWVETELSFGETNRGNYGLKENVSRVLRAYASAIFVEDDCLPMPGFYSYMTQALEHYECSRDVFSIGGYQPVEYRHLKNSHASLVSCPRFMMWGWATWRDRWEFAYPYLSHAWELFHDAQDVPDTAGHDFPRMVRVPPHQRDVAWDWEIALTTLWLRQMHLLPTRGLIRSIGQDGTGWHKGHPHVQNRNVSDTPPGEIAWLENVEPHPDYIRELKKFVVRATRPEYIPLGERARERANAAYWAGRGVAGKVKRAIIRPPRKPAPKRFFDVVLEQSQAPLEKHALLSYVADRFDIARSDPRFLQHIVIWHAQEIVRILNRLGYRVDVIGYDDRAFVPRRAYDLFVGHMGLNFTQIARALPPHAKKIYLSNTNYWDYHNKQEMARFDALKERRGVELPLVYDRFLHYPEDAALRAADGIVGFGNSFTRATYRDFSPVINVNNIALADDHFARQNKDYEQGRRHWLFYSGPGNVHKGLDLLLDGFSALPDQHLWICTQLEKDFEQAYVLALHHRPNIHLVGLIQPRSATYYALVDRCNFTILPSCSDAASQSVVEGMNQGLIPVVSRECTLEVRDWGELIEPCTIDEIVKVVERMSGLTAAQCRERSVKAHAEAVTNCSESAFSLSMQHALETILQGVGDG